MLAAVAAQAAAVAAHDDALVVTLTAAYARQQARKLAKAARAVARAVKKAAKKVAHAAVTVAKAAYKYSGAQDVVSCVTNPHLSSCIKAAVTVALVVATAGEGEVEVAAMNAAEEGAEQAGKTSSIAAWRRARIRRLVWSPVPQVRMYPPSAMLPVRSKAHGFLRVRAWLSLQASMGRTAWWALTFPRSLPRWSTSQAASLAEV